MKKSLTIAAVLIASAAPAQAHDFWIEAAPFAVPVGGVVRVSLHHGDFFMGEAVQRDPDRIDSFQVIGPRGTQPVLGRSGAVTGFARPEEPGLHVIAYHSGRVRNELPAEKFEQYLREKDLVTVIETRAQRGESNTPGREVYSRCAKALIQAGDPGAAQADRPLGLPLEIVAEGNPCTQRPGGQLRVQVLYHGEPLGGIPVVALNRDDPGERIVRPTDGGGHATIRLEPPGDWMLSSVYMVAAPPGTDADWESFWASLTFQVPRP